jgi:hypothetical protein
VRVASSVWPALDPTITAHCTACATRPSRLTVGVGIDIHFPPGDVTNGSIEPRNGTIAADNPAVVVVIVSPGDVHPDDRVADCLRSPGVQYILFVVRQDVLHHRVGPAHDIITSPMTSTLSGGSMVLDSPDLSVDLDTIPGSGASGIVAEPVGLPTGILTLTRPLGGLPASGTPAGGGI